MIKQCKTNCDKEGEIDKCSLLCGIVLSASCLLLTEFVQYKLRNSKIYKGTETVELILLKKGHEGFTKILDILS